MRRAGRRGGWAGHKRRGQRVAYGATILSMASSIQFIKGIKEPSVPDVKLTRARDGSSGTAMFTFNQPSVFEASSDLGDITGLYLEDDEGLLQTVDVQAKFVNGKPDRIEAKYTMRSSFEWDRRAAPPRPAVRVSCSAVRGVETLLARSRLSACVAVPRPCRAPGQLPSASRCAVTSVRARGRRFMRFMERYADENELGFTKRQGKQVRVVGPNPPYPRPPSRTSPCPTWLAAACCSQQV